MITPPAVALVTLAASLTGSPTPEPGAVFTEQGVRFTVRVPHDDADSVRITGPVEVELAPVEGSGDLWSGGASIERANEAVMSGRVVIIKDGAVSLGDQLPVLRGPDAPPAPEIADPLMGTVETFQLGAEILGEPRGVSLYTPPVDAEIRQLIYMTDGGEFRKYAAVVEPLVTSGAIPPTSIVAVESGGQDMNAQGMAADLRAAEYIKGIARFSEEIDPERFDRHFEFFVSFVPGWAEGELGVELGAEDRILFGASNGGDFVAYVGATEPGVFGNAIPCSMSWFEGPTWFEGSGPVAQRVFFGAGLYEPDELGITKSSAEAARASGRTVEFRERVGGHEATIWREILADALVWLAKGG